MGSSANTQAGRVTSARVIATRWRSPPDSYAGLWSSRPARPTAAKISRVGAQRERQTGEQDSERADGSVGFTLTESQSHLFTLDLATGAATDVGPHGVAYGRQLSYSGLAFRDDGTLPVKASTRWIRQP